MGRLEYIQRETAQMYAATKGIDNALALKCLARMEQQLATAVRVREFIQKGTPQNGGKSVADALSEARKRLVIARENAPDAPDLAG